jgi:hypothetical protein
MTRPTMKTAAVFAAVMAFGSVALAGTDLTFKELPAPVQQTTQREVAGGTNEDIERDDKQGATVYEIEFTHNGKSWEIDVAPDGKLLKREED